MRTTARTPTGWSGPTHSCRGSDRASAGNHRRGQRGSRRAAGRRDTGLDRELQRPVEGAEPTRYTRPIPYVPAACRPAAGAGPLSADLEAGTAPPPAASRWAAAANCRSGRAARSRSTASRWRCSACATVRCTQSAPYARMPAARSGTGDRRQGRAMSLAPERLSSRRRRIHTGPPPLPPIPCISTAPGRGHEVPADRA